MAEVVDFPGLTEIPEDPVVTLEKAKSWGLQRVLICGFSESGEFIFGGSHSELPETLLLAQLAIKRLTDEADA